MPQVSSNLLLCYRTEERLRGGKKAFRFLFFLRFSEESKFVVSSARRFRRFACMHAVLQHLLHTLLRPLRCVLTGACRERTVTCRTSACGLFCCLLLLVAAAGRHGRAPPESSSLFSRRNPSSLFGCCGVGRHDASRALASCPRHATCFACSLFRSSFRVWATSVGLGS